MRSERSRKINKLQRFFANIKELFEMSERSSYNLLLVKTSQKDHSIL